MLSVKKIALIGVVVVPSLCSEGVYAQVPEEIIVTGTRIKQSNLLASSPVTSLTNEDIATRGITRVEDLINELPQVFAGQGSNISNGATGIATVDLRGLGASRTLVLIDGRRMASGTINQIAPDLNQIPAALVKNIDVLTGSVGAVYGSDALAGVVNFQMERDFEGLRLDAQIGVYQHSNGNEAIQTALRSSENLANSLKGNQLDGATKDFTLIYGHNFRNGNGNITAYLGYRDAKEILQSSRDYSGCPIRGGGIAGGQIFCGGSLTNATGTFSINTDGRLFTIDPTTGNTFQQVSLTDQAGLPSINFYNFNSATHIQRPDKRYTIGLFAHYDLGYRDEVYSNLMYATDNSISQTAPSGNFFSSNLVSCDNPFLSNQQRDIICTSKGLGPNDTANLSIGRRNIEGEPRQTTLQHKSYRIVAGLRGDFRLLEGLEYDISAQFSSAKLDQEFNNEVSIRNIQNALLVTTDANGIPICDSVVNGTDLACVPINYFQIGGVTQSALDYISTRGQQNGRYKQTIMLATISGSLENYGIVVPGASSSAKFVLGGEYRKDDYFFNPDAALISGDIAGKGMAEVGFSGVFDSLETFGELQIPLLENRAYAKNLTFKGAYRYADNSLAGGNSTYSVGGIWQINDIIRLRGNYQRALRVANAIELFQSKSLTLFNSSAGDPCAGSSPTATLSQCANSGVTFAQYGNIAINPTGQFNAIVGGSTNLNPEKSDTFTIGGIVQGMGNFDGFSASIDYFDIAVNDFIDTAQPIQSINECVFNADPFFCDLIKRDPNSGSLWQSENGFVEAKKINTGSLFTTGIDINARYEKELPSGLGGLSVSLTGTYLINRITQSIPNGPKKNCVGLYGDLCGSPSQRWRHIASINWQTDHNFDAHINWRHFADVKADIGLNVQTGSFDENLGAADYFDLAFTYRGLSDATIRVGVNNIFDKEPPLSTSIRTSAGNGNTYPQVYDALGRFLFARITLDY